MIKGTAPSLTQTPASPLNALLKNSGSDALVFAASVVPSDNFFPQGGPQARILQMAKSGSIGLGVDGTQTFAHLALVADSDTSADKLTKILQGVTALLSLGESNNKALTDFMNSATVQRTGDTVTLDLSYASARLAEMIKNLQNGRRGLAPPAPLRQGRRGMARPDAAAAAAPDAAPAPRLGKLCGKRAPRPMAR